MVAVTATIQVITRGILVLVEEASTGAGTWIILFLCIFSAHLLLKLMYLRFYNEDKMNVVDRSKWNFLSLSYKCIHGFLSEYISLYVSIQDMNIIALCYFLVLIGWDPSLCWFFRSSSYDSANRPVVAYSDLDVPDIAEMFWRYESIVLL
jgi:hypothetical protein